MLAIALHVAEPSLTAQHHDKRTSLPPEWPPGAADGPERPKRAQPVTANRRRGKMRQPVAREKPNPVRIMAVPLAAESFQRQGDPWMLAPFSASVFLAVDGGRLCRSQAQR